MNKNGFIFIETIIVLVVTALSLVMLLSSYTLVVTKSKEKNYYDLSSDVYLLYNISKIGTSSTDNYSIINTNIYVNKENCVGSFVSKYLGNCTNLFNDTDLAYLGVFNDLTQITKVKDADAKVIIPYNTNGTIQYLKTLKACNDTTSSTCNNKVKYLVGVFYRNQKYYYASLELG